jgi:hypothetical protein
MPRRNERYCSLPLFLLVCWAKMKLGKESRPTRYGGRQPGWLLLIFFMTSGGRTDACGLYFGRGR